MNKLITSIILLLIFINIADANIDSIYLNGLNENDSFTISSVLKVKLLNGNNIRAAFLRNRPGGHFYLGCPECSNIKFKDVNYVKVYDYNSILKGRILGTATGIVVCIGLMALTPSSTKKYLRDSGWGSSVGMAGILSFGLIGYYGLGISFAKCNKLIFIH